MPGRQPCQCLVLGAWRHPSCIQASWIAVRRFTLSQVWVLPGRKLSLAVAAVNLSGSRCRCATAPPLHLSPLLAVAFTRPHRALSLPRKGGRERWTAPSRGRRQLRPGARTRNPIASSADVGFRARARNPGEGHCRRRGEVVARNFGLTPEASRRHTSSHSRARRRWRAGRRACPRTRCGRGP